MWALIYEGKVADIVAEDPQGKYHPSFEIAIANNETKIGMLYKNGIFFYEAPSKEWVEDAERAWRDSELVRADGELNKVQDADPKAVGTVAEWRTYRKALRNYPDLEGFPSKDLRPVSP